MIIGLLIYFLYGKEHSVLGRRYPAGSLAASGALPSSLK